MSLEEIGEGYDALLCLTDQPACCRLPYTKPMGQTAIGNWFFPNETRVPSSGGNWGFHRTRGPSVVLMARVKGGVDGIYYCNIPDTAGVIQTVYIGVYNTSTGECYNTCTYTPISYYIYSKKRTSMWQSSIEEGQRLGYVIEWSAHLAWRSATA